MIILTESAVARIWLDEALPALGVTWLGPITSAEYRATLEDILAYWQAERPHRLAAGQPLLGILCDTTRAQVLSLEDQMWIATNWVPRAVGAGLRRLAYVTPQDLYARVAIQGRIQFNSRVAPELRSAQLPSREAAGEWLRKMAPTPSAT